MSTQLLASFIEREMKLGGAADVTLNRQQWQLVLAALRAQGWISVQERLPAGEYLSDAGNIVELEVCFRGEVRRGYYTAVLKEWRLTGSPSNFNGDITHWQPLPAPPNERAK